MKIFAILLLFVPVFSFAQQHTLLGIDVAKQELKTALRDKKQGHELIKNIIGDKETAISVAEPVLFKIYGKSQIMSERPYEIYLIGHYWVINGTLPKRMLGGGFVIVISSQDGQIIRLTHYK